MMFAMFVVDDDGGLRRGVFELGMRDGYEICLCRRPSCSRLGTLEPQVKIVSHLSNILRK